MFVVPEYKSQILFAILGTIGRYAFGQSKTEQKKSE
jgi:hypothetical protein